MHCTVLKILHNLIPKHLIICHLVPCLERFAFGMNAMHWPAVAIHKDVLAIEQQLLLQILFCSDPM